MKFKRPTYGGYGCHFFNKIALNKGFIMDDGLNIGFDEARGVVRGT